MKWLIEEEDIAKNVKRLSRAVLKLEEKIKKLNTQYPPIVHKIVSKDAQGELGVLREKYNKIIKEIKDIRIRQGLMEEKMEKMMKEILKEVKEIKKQMKKGDEL